jgi:glycosyltransferase involved in cell wall biosynthesis
MRVIQVVGTFSPRRCGVAHYTARLAEQLAMSEVDSAIASGRAEGESSVPHLTIPGLPHSLVGLTNLLRAARAWKADWVHVQFAPGTFDRHRSITYFPLLGRLLRGPRVAVTLHEFGGWAMKPPAPFAKVMDRGFNLAERRGWVDRETLSLISLSDLAVATNQEHVAAIRARSTALAKRLNVVPIGPNVVPASGRSTERRATRSRLGVDDEEVVILYFGFVHPVKGIETLIRAIRLAREHSPRIALWIIGGVHSLALRGAEADGYEQSVRDLIVAEQAVGIVDFPGYLSDEEVARRFTAADIAVLPFNHGATMKSGSLITCLANGLPTITTLGGDVKPLRHGDDVWLVPPRDPSALAEALVRLARDSAARERLGSGARIASQEFTWHRIVARHLDLYAGNAITGVNTSETRLERRPR